jgi:hypothetical protein
MLRGPRLYPASQRISPRVSTNPPIPRKLSTSAAAQLTPHLHDNAPFDELSDQEQGAAAEAGCGVDMQNCREAEEQKTE